MYSGGNTSIFYLVLLKSPLSFFILILNQYYVISKKSLPTPRQETAAFLRSS